MRHGVMVSVLALALVTGCAKTQLIGTLPPITDPDETAEIYLIRTNALSARIRSVTVAVNGEEVLQLASNQYTRIRVPADEYNREISVGARLPEGVEGWDQVSLICMPGDVYYLLIDSGQQDDLMTRLSADEGPSRLEGAEFVDIGGRSRP